MPSHQLPALWSNEIIIDRNKARQLVVPAADYTIIAEDGLNYAETAHGKWRLLNPSETYSGTAPALRLAAPFVEGETPDLSHAEWLTSPTPSSPAEVIDSLQDAFTFLREDETRGRKGLRLPQIGALHAVIGYWTTAARQPAMVVMPTGTGKTETMLSLFAAERLERVLVVVPSDALRKQTAKKFEKYGVLQEFGVVDPVAMRPVVGYVEHGFKTVEAARNFARSCNVIITTPNALTKSEWATRNALLAECSHLFIDEAHHVTAVTWRQIRDQFTEKRTVQFTVTPFREDGAMLGGRLLYQFPLREAQRLGYFSKINYISVVDFDDPDRAIALRAIQALREDLAANLDHIMMARVRSVPRANDLLELYNELASDLNPIVMHSRLRQRDRRAAQQALETHATKIVICVNMLGEGFDLPSLKIAAIHDAHKSLGVTLQFVGRFARVGDSSLGTATAVVNRGEVQHDKRLKALYAEDSDWNYVIQNLSAGAVGEQEELSDFATGFGGSLPDEISLQNIAPKMSTVVYKTNTTAWHPDRLEDHFKERLLTRPLAINEQEHVAWLVTRDITSVRWGDVKNIADVTYGLYVFYWDSAKQLLYINSSSNDGVHEDLAKLLCGETVERYHGKSVYKTMVTILRRIPTNIGLLDVMNRSSRFEMHAGSNVDEALPDARRTNKTQTNIFAHGFSAKDGDRISIGASVKGRIWSHMAATNLVAWMKWCDHIGRLISDDSIDPAEVMAGFIVPEELNDRPPLVALALEWATEAFLDTSEDIQVMINGSRCALLDAELKITDFKPDGAIPFTVETPDGQAAQYKLEMRGGEMHFTATGQPAEIVMTRGTTLPFEDYLKRIGVRVILEKQAIIEPSMILVKPVELTQPYSLDKITTIDWTGINIQNEPQGAARDASSVQARAIEYVKTLGEWDVIIDDDGSGEMADIVAVKIEGDKLIVRLVHCKAAHGNAPGARLADLYEVCGQAQKSVARRRKPETMLRNLIRREKNRRQAGRNGFMLGDAAKLQDAADKAELLIPEFTISIVQPGLSKRQASTEQLELLAATENYVNETGGGTPLEVVSSD
jgi:superfamily II DNA or RNA helicase